MKGFLSNLLASILGCAIVIGAFVLLSFLSLIAISLSSNEKFKLKDNTVLTLKLDGSLVDRVQTDNPFMDLFDQTSENIIGMDDIISSIKKAKDNDKIKGIYINVGAFSASSPSLREIRNELIDFKKSGKFIISYSDVYSQGCYYLASVSDKIILNPKGHLDLHGLSSSPMFYKGLLEKLGIQMQIFKVGTFKSAVEPFMLDKMSDANRKQVTEYIGDIWSTIISEISESRNISSEKLNAITDSLNVFTKEENNLSNRLVDTLMYETEVKEYLKTLLNVENVKDINYASVKNMYSVSEKTKNDSEDIVAVLYAQGSINTGASREDIADKRYVKEIEKLKDNEKVKAVVFRVNSPGGSAYASEQIWKAITDLKEKKPVVVSMGDYAASGGYYISCNASKIIAQPNTLTGSIGIFGMFPDVEGLTKKVGLTFDNVKTNKHADFGDPTRPMRDDEKALLQNYIERGYDLFLTRCSEGRGIPKDSLDLIAQGRVWTGNQAIKIGLVDALGGIDTAIEEAVKLAGLDEYSISSFPKKVDFFENFLSMKKEELTTRAMKEYLGEDYKLFKIMKEIKEQDYIQARLPYDFDMK